MRIEIRVPSRVQSGYVAIQRQKTSVLVDALLFSYWDLNQEHISGLDIFRERVDRNYLARTNR